MNNIQFRLYDDFNLIEKKWISFQKHASYYYFQNIDWVKRWYLTIGKNEKTLIVEIFINKSNTIAILPFSISSFNGIKIMSWIGGDYGCGIYSNEFNKIVDKKTFKILWKNIKKNLKGTDLIYLTKQPKYVSKILNPFVDNLNVYKYHNLSYQIRLFEDWNETYLSINKKIRHDTNRQIKRLSKLGNLDFNVAVDAANYQNLFNILIKYKSDQYNRTGTVNIFNEEVYKNFYISFDSNIKNNNIHLSALTIDKKVIALNWGAVDEKNKIFFYLIPAYSNDEWAKFSPGNIMMMKLVEWCCNNKLKFFDMTSGNELYKKRWSNSNFNIYNYKKSLSIKGNLYSTLISLKNKSRKFT